MHTDLTDEEDRFLTLQTTAHSEEVNLESATKTFKMNSRWDLDNHDLEGQTSLGGIWGSDKVSVHKAYVSCSHHSVFSEELFGARGQ